MPLLANDLSRSQHVFVQQKPPSAEEEICTNPAPPPAMPVLSSASKQTFTTGTPNIPHFTMGLAATPMVPGWEVAGNGWGQLWEVNLSVCIQE